MTPYPFAEPRRWRTLMLQKKKHARLWLLRPVPESRLSVPCRLCGHRRLKKLTHFNSDSLTISSVDSVTQSDFVSAHDDCR